ncbi:hypothetical protein Cni_G13119 [Canna indica]|uniref:COMM domain-containing protein n=1 Tax=Canna indica TaxID=4628 RepID=A0AAQ3K904_9LILI|nr:hypothetical protein Cni_G13119 [Canna indica]
MAEGHRLWEYLPLLVQSSSKESVEYILQVLWRTRKTGLDAADRGIIRDMLHLSSDADLDPLLVCLRMLIRKCVYGNISKDEIQKLFPNEVLPELQRLLTLLLQKFQREWREDVLKDQLQDDTHSVSGGSKVKFQLRKDALETMLKSMYSLRDQMSSGDASSNGHGQEQEAAKT